MSTRSRISKVDVDGYIRSIYCHFDGYIDGVGKTLIDNYNTVNSIDKLFELGDLSALDDTLETTKAYHRDFYEDLKKPLLFRNKENLINYFCESDCDYLYLFDTDNKWYVFTRKLGKFEPVESFFESIIAKI